MGGCDIPGDLSKAWAKGYRNPQDLAAFRRAVIEAEETLALSPDNGVFQHELACAKSALTGAKEGSLAVSLLVVRNRVDTLAIFCGPVESRPVPPSDS